MAVAPLMILGKPSREEGAVGLWLMGILHYAPQSLPSSLIPSTYYGPGRFNCRWKKYFFVRMSYLPLIWVDVYFVLASFRVFTISLNPPVSSLVSPQHSSSWGAGAEVPCFPYRPREAFQNHNEGPPTNYLCQVMWNSWGNWVCGRCPAWTN